MKSNKFVEELKTKSDAELAQELCAVSAFLTLHHMDRLVLYTARIKEVRRNIARIQTVITEKARA